MFSLFFSHDRTINTLTRIVVIFSLTVPMALSAQTPASNLPTADDTTEPLSQERLEELLETLESETARTEFINHLKTLLAAEQEKQASEDEEETLSVSELLDLDTKSDGVTAGIQNVIDELEISETAAGNVLTFAIITVLVGLVVFINAKVASILDRRLDKVRDKYHLPEKRFKPLFKIQRVAGYCLGIAIVVYAALQIFTFWPEFLATYLSGETILQYALSLLLIIVIFTGVWEMVNGVMEIAVPRNQHFSSSRAQTLLPVIRNILLVVMITLAGLVVLSELGIDIMPLLAGAGIFGIAVGFGAQTLVKDFLTGFIIIFEDLIQVGDVVQVGDRRGIIEKISIRKVQLRDLDGTVHTVPYSEIAVVDNLTKDYSYYLMDIGVAFREDVDEVIQCLHSIDEKIRASENYKDDILEPLEILGLDKFADSAVVIRARIKTKAHQKWFVGREFNRLMKIAFDKEGIEIPFPHQTLYFGEDKDGKAPSAKVNLFEQEQRAGRSESEKSKPKTRESTKTSPAEDAHSNIEEEASESA